MTTSLLEGENIRITLSQPGHRTKIVHIFGNVFLRSKKSGNPKALDQYCNIFRIDHFSGWYSSFCSRCSETSLFQKVRTTFLLKIISFELCFLEILKQTLPWFYANDVWVSAEHCYCRRRLTKSILNLFLHSRRRVSNNKMVC